MILHIVKSCLVIILFSYVVTSAPTAEKQACNCSSHLQIKPSEQSCLLGHMLQILTHLVNNQQHPMCPKVILPNQTNQDDSKYETLLTEILKESTKNSLKQNYTELQEKGTTAEENHPISKTERKLEFNVKNDDETLDSQISKETRANSTKPHTKEPKEERDILITKNQSTQTERNPKSESNTTLVSEILKEANEECSKEKLKLSGEIEHFVNEPNPDEKTNHYLKAESLVHGPNASSFKSDEASFELSDEKDSLEMSDKKDNTHISPATELSEKKYNSASKIVQKENIDKQKLDDQIYSKLPKKVELTATSSKEKLSPPINTEKEYSYSIREENMEKESSGETKKPKQQKNEVIEVVSDAKEEYSSTLKTIEENLTQKVVLDKESSKEENLEEKNVGQTKKNKEQKTTEESPSPKVTYEVSEVVSNTTEEYSSTPNTVREEHLKKENFQETKKPNEPKALEENHAPKLSYDVSEVVSDKESSKEKLSTPKSTQEEYSYGVQQGNLEKESPAEIKEPKEQKTMEKNASPKLPYEVSEGASDKDSSNKKLSPPKNAEKTYNYGVNEENLEENPGVTEKTMEENTSPKLSYEVYEVVSDAKEGYSSTPTSVKEENLKEVIQQLSDKNISEVMLEQSVQDEEVDFTDEPPYTNTDVPPFLAIETTEPTKNQNASTQHTESTTENYETVKSEESFNSSDFQMLFIPVLGLKKNLTNSDMTSCILKLFGGLSNFTSRSNH